MLNSQAPEAPQRPDGRALSQILIVVCCSRRRRGRHRQAGKNGTAWEVVKHDVDGLDDGHHLNGCAGGSRAPPVPVRAPASPRGRQTAPTSWSARGAWRAAR